MPSEARNGDKLERLVRFCLGSHIGAVTAALPMVLSWLRFGPDSYAHGFMVCLLCWWLYEQRPSKSNIKAGE